MILFMVEVIGNGIGSKRCECWVIFSIFFRYFLNEWIFGLFSL